MKVYTIEENVGVYTVSASKTYSSNPAYVLMDYLTNSEYGRGLGFDEIDLESFYNSAQICDTVVLTDAEVTGHAFGSKPVSNYPTLGNFPNPDDWGFEEVLLRDDSTGNHYAWNKTGGTDDDPKGEFVAATVPTRDIKLYEANMTLPSDVSIRDNIEAILDTMNYAELTWDTNGTYKLLLEYPVDDAATTALVTHAFDKDNIIRDSFNIAFPTAEERFNHVTVSFDNEHDDFQTDTVSWPDKKGGTYTAYLEEDSGQPLETSISPIITNPYNAKAKAEQIVRASRSSYNISFTSSQYGLTLEPGDFITVELDEVGLEVPTDFRVQEVKVNNRFQCEIKAYKFDADVLAWNVNDGITYKNKEIFDNSISGVTNIALSQTGLVVSSIGRLSWSFSDDQAGNTYSYEVYYKLSSETDYKFLGITQRKALDFGDLDDLLLNQPYDFGVRTRSVFGTRSGIVELTGQTINAAPLALVSVSAEDELYVTNSASGVKSRLNIFWSPDNSLIEPFSYRVEYRILGFVSSNFLLETGTDSLLLEGGTDSLLLDPALIGNSEFISETTTALSMKIFDLSPADWEIRVTPVSFYGYEGPSTTFTKAVLGLTAPPAAPTGFSGNINEGQINLSWDLPTDLDVIYGGSVEIRFHNSVGVSASWDSSTVLVGNLSGNTNNKTVPTLQGTFLIKFKDTTGIYSDSVATFVSTFQDSSFNQITTLDEDSTSYTGTKTNCTVSGTDLILDANETTMTYDFSSYVDLGEVVTSRIYPYMDATVVSATTTVDSYVNVAAVTNFAGPLGSANVNVYISTTQDDPTGSPTWSSYEILSIGSFSARAVRFRLIGVANPGFEITITNLGVIIDKKDIVKTGSSTSSASADVTVTYATAFYGGTGGTQVPTIGLQIIGGSQGDEIVIPTRTATNFSYSIYNATNRVVRTVDWQAIGQ